MTENPLDWWNARRTTLTRYWRQQEGREKEEITHTDYMAAAEVAGLRLGNLMNYTVGDTAYSFTHIFDPSPEELEEWKQRWKENWEEHKNDPPALLLNYGESVPDGWTGRVQWRSPALDELPVITQKFDSITFKTDTPDGGHEYRYPHGVLASKFSGVVEVPYELMNDAAFDLEEYLANPPKRMLKRKIKERSVTWRQRLAALAYAWITGHDITEDWAYPEDE